MTIAPIDKPCIFLTSSGRTGTLFFGTLLRRIIHDCSSYHEPDVMTKTDWSQWSFVVREFGFVPSTVGKITPKGSLRALGVGRVRGVVSDDEAVQRLRSMRNRFISGNEQQVYCEANQQLLLLTDLLPIAFPNSHAIYIVRDPRDWVRSCMNIPSGWYTWRDFTLWLPNGKLIPRCMREDPAQRRWGAMSRFERLCWAWNAYNSFTHRKIADSDHIRMLRFEDLFESSDADAHVSALLSQVTRFPSGEQARWQIPEGIMQQKIHAATPDHSHWRQWSADWCRTLHRHCGDLMHQFGYGTEPEWLEKCGQARERQHA